MRHPRLPLILALTLLLGLGGAAAEKLPKDFGTIYALIQGAVIDLEPHRPDLIRRPDFRGYSSEFLKLPRDRASARFSEHASLAWTVCSRAEAPDDWGLNWFSLHPTGFQLHKLKVENDARVLMLVETNPYAETEHSGLPLKVTPTEPNNLRIESGAALSPGEYALVHEPRNGAATVYCFGIDPVTP